MEARALALHPGAWTTWGRRAAFALLAWAVLIGVTVAWGELLNGAGADILLGAPPLSGRFNPGLQPQGLVTLVVAGTIVATAPWLRDKLGWGGLLVAAFAGAWLWAGALDLIDGGYWLTVPVLKPDEYLRDVPLVGSPAALFHGLTTNPNVYVNHVQTHPPGMLLTLWGMDRIGAGGAMPAALLMVTGGAASVPAALVAGREVMGEERARAAAPFLVLAPAAIWIATSADAFFAGVACWGVALVVLATGRDGLRADALALAGGLLLGAALMLSYGLVLMWVLPAVIAIARRRLRTLAGVACWGVALVVLATGRDGLRADALALAGGLLLGAALMLSYGLVLMWVVPAVIAIARRRLRTLAVAALGPVIVLGGFALGGFWWFDGYSASRNAHNAGIAATRPYGFFFVDDLAAFAVALGPAVCVGLAGLRERGERLMVGAALAAVLLADLTGLSKGEVERIWLPFAPLVMLGAAGLPRERGATRAWLAGAALFAAFVEVLVRTAW